MTRISKGEIEALPLLAAVPGVLVVLVLDLLFSHVNRIGWVEVLWLRSASLLILPWWALWRYDAKPAALGFVSSSLGRALSIGICLGALWRALSLLVNLTLLEWPGLGFHGSSLPGALLLIPFLEEVFYRGYLGRTFVRGLGPGIGIPLQAFLFMLAPSHLPQRGPHLAWIFFFGLVAGGAVTRWNSLWTALAAHAAANLIPFLLMWIGF